MTCKATGEGEAAFAYFHRVADEDIRAALAPYVKLAKVNRERSRVHGVTDKWLATRAVLLKLKRDLKVYDLPHKTKYLESLHSSWRAYRVYPLQRATTRASVGQGDWWLSVPTICTPRHVVRAFVRGGDRALLLLGNILAHHGWERDIVSHNDHTNAGRRY